MDVSDRRMQVQLTQEAKIASDFLYIRAIFAVAGFVSALCHYLLVMAVVASVIIFRPMVCWHPQLVVVSRIFRVVSRIFRKKGLQPLA